MQVVTSLPRLQAWLDQSKRGFSVEAVTWADMQGWHFHEGALSHRSGGFFSVAGVEFPDLKSKQAILLFQPQSAITGLLTTVMDGERHFLLQARVEPGTPGQAQYGPTLQSTPANYLRAHGGKATAYVDRFTTCTPSVRILHDSMQLDLGERYLLKSKRLIVAECAHDIAQEEGFVWVAARVISQAIRQPTFFNIDLCSLLAVCAWDEPGEGQLRPVEPAVQASLQLPVRAERLGAVLTELQGPIARYRFRDIGRLDNWEISPNGIHERERRQGFDLGYFFVAARGREVGSWYQPLVNSRFDGQAVLACRMQEDALEVRVRIGAESGLQTGKALLPSYLRYPGTLSTEQAPSGQVLLRTAASDEGGRFFCDVSRYELVMTSPTDEAPGVWLRVSELKWLLANSNLIAIQLRGLTSLLLGNFECSESA